MFSEKSEGDNFELNDLNLILKNIYDSNFFKDVDVTF